MNPIRWCQTEWAIRSADRLARRGNLSAALQRIEKARERSPRKVSLYIQRAWLLADLRRHAEALETVEGGLELDGQNGILQMIRGEILYAQRNYEEAQKAFQRALEFSGENLRVEYGLGLTYLALGDFDRASQLFESSIRYDKTLVQSRLLVMAEHYLLTQRKQAS